jgi:glutathione S-transferase
MFAKSKGHPCWKVQKALDEMGIEYEVVAHRGLPGMNRGETLKKTGQKKYPWLEFEDGTFYRNESAVMAERILAGELDAVTKEHLLS